MCPIPPGSGLWGVRTSYIHFSNFPGHLEFWTPLQIPSWGPPLGCTLLQDPSVTGDSLLASRELELWLSMPEVGEKEMNYLFKSYTGLE